MRTLALIFIIFFAQTASAQVLVNEIQISPINERFIELYNSGDTDVDLTDWYIQRKTATGSSFGSLVTKTQLNGKIIKARGYFLISRSALEKSDVVLGSLVLTESNAIRVRDSKEKDVDQIEWGSIAEGKSYQRTPSGIWEVAIPTPGSTNASAQGTNTNLSTTSSTVTSAVSNVSSFPIEPQIFANIKSNTNTTLVGAQITFTAKVFGLKKEPIENARSLWAFGDGAYREGESVMHTYFYPGEYTVVLDASSGYFSASDRIRVTVTVPNILLATGGDDVRSFVSVENRSADEIDLSNWQIFANNKTFIFPKNTFLPARKNVLFASEITGLSTPLGVTAELRFPNGERVPLNSDEKKNSNSASPSLNYEEVIPSTGEIIISNTTVVPEKRVIKNSYDGQASIAEAFDYTDISNETRPSQTEESTKKSLLPWYIGIAFMSAFALLALRYTRKDDESKGKNEDTELSADDFEIIEEK